MGRKNKERYFVYLPCKPYVRQFLLHNYGVNDPQWPDLITIVKDEFIYQQFRSRLTHASGRYDSRYGDLSRYSTKVQIEIKKDDFYRYGWALTETDTVSLCGIFEARAKSFLCTYLDIHRALGVPLSTAIRNFQDKYDFPEDVWPYDSIRREYSRNGPKESIPMVNEFFNIINKILMVNLSRNGTISRQAMKAYEAANI